MGSQDRAQVDVIKSVCKWHMEKFAERMEIVLTFKVISVRALGGM